MQATYLAAACTPFCPAAVSHPLFLVLPLSRHPQLTFGCQPSSHSAALAAHGPPLHLQARLAGLCDVQQSYFEVLAETLDSTEEMALEVSEDNDPAVMLAGLQEACELIIDSISGATQRQS